MNETFRNCVGIIVALIIVLALVVLGAWGIPRYKVYSQTLRGKAELREAEWSRQVLIEEAQAAKQAEVLRAEGMAEANQIIGKSLDGNEDYLHYLWLQGLTDANTDIIYVPTEANLPILEASRQK